MGKAYISNLPYQIGICMANFLYLVNKSQLAERFDVSAVFFN